MSHAANVVAGQPAARVPVLDQAHLKRMTFGDLNLERELLKLFDRQSEILLARMRVSDPPAVATLAHTLKGSAAGIGAVSVAQAAEVVELTAGRAAGKLADALAQLDQAVGETRAIIAELLQRAD
jgi:HPt (histidine-containing phosphotransfer) domain-containing protein